VRVTPYGSVIAVSLDGNFDASLILLDELWNGPLAHFVESGFVAAVPSRDVLAFCDRDSDAGRNELRGVISRVMSGGDRLIAERLYARSGER